MLSDAERRLTEFLARTVRELKALREMGRLQDPMSRAEIEFLEQELLVAKARAVGAEPGAPDPETRGVPDDPPLRSSDPGGGARPNQDP